MPSRETHLYIANNTTTDIVSTSVSGVDNFDWDKGAGPHRNFVNVFIGAKKWEKRREEVNFWAKHCPFTMTLRFRDGSVDTFRVNQKSAIGSGGADFKHIQRSHDLYHTSEKHNKTTVIRIENTAQQLQNQRAEQLNNEAKAKIQQKQYEEALRKLDEAFRTANQATTKEKITNNKADTYYQHGQSLMQEGWTLESKDKAQEAEKKFNEAKSKFQQAQSVRNTTDIQKSLKLVNSKIEANRIFNEALKKEKEAFDLYQKARDSNIFNDYASAQKKYEEALHKYEEAMKIFQEGSKIDKAKFGECVKIVKEQIEKVTKVVNDIERAELNYNINKVHVNEAKKEEKKQEEQVNSNLQEQIDA